MAFSGIIGLGLSVLPLIYYGWWYSHGWFFLDSLPLVSVVGGSIAVTLTRYSLKEVIDAFLTSFSVLLRRNRRPDVVIDEMSAYAIKVEHEGPASLTDFRAGTKDFFTVEGLALVSKGISPERIEHQMLPKVAAVARKYGNVGSVLGFLTSIAFPLTFMWGLVWAIVWIQNMDDPSCIGPAIASALLVPLYGCIMVAMLTLPLSGRARAYGKARQLDMLLRLEGFKYLAAGMVHTDVESRLSVRLARLGIDTRLQEFSSDLPKGIIPTAAGGR